MKVNTYANRVTKGTMELDSDVIYRAFPFASQMLIDAVLDEMMLKGDKRISRCIGEMKDWHTITLRAQSTLHEGDEFNEEIGQLNVRLKLHNKALEFVMKVLHGLNHAINEMTRNIDKGIPIDGLGEIREKVLTGVMPFHDKRLFVNIGEDCSVARLVIIPKPTDEDEVFDTWAGEFNMQFIAQNIMNAALNNVSFNRKNYSFWDLRCKAEECLVKECRRNGGKIEIVAIVRRNKDDEHDEKQARMALCNKLQAQYEAFCKRMAHKVVKEVLGKQFCNHKPCSHKCWVKYTKMRNKLRAMAPGIFEQDGKNLDWLR